LRIADFDDQREEIPHSGSGLRMKKVALLITVFCLISFPVIHAQVSFDKGKIMVGVSSVHPFSGNWGSDFMSLGFSSSKYVSSSGISSDPDKSIGIVILPKAGYFLMDNLATGLELVAGYYRETDGYDNDKYISTLISVGPWVRYYYPLDKINPFAELNFGFGSEKDKYDSGSSESEYKYSLMSIGGGVGVAIPIGDRVAFDAMAGYNHLTFKEKDTGELAGKEKTGSFGLKMGFVVFFSGF